MKPLKIAHLSGAFVAMGAMVALILAAYIWLEMQSVTANLRTHEQEAAAEEVEEAIDAFRQHMVSVSAGLANWDETRQQLVSSEFYNLWRDLRVRDAGIIPDNVDTVALYDSAGNILAPSAPGLPMPGHIAMSKPTSIYSWDEGHSHIHHFFPIFADSNAQVLLGYGGVKFDLLAELATLSSFRYADISSFKLAHANDTELNFATLPGQIEFDLLPNPSADLFKHIFQNALLRLLGFVLIILVVAAWLLHRLMVRPLRMISEEIDNLRHHPSEPLQAPAQLRQPLPVYELENVRLSFKSYQSRLAELHSNLEQTSRDFHDQARRDALTSAFNRRAFEEDWRESDLLQECDCCALLLFDCDHFKAINDTYGHDVGDEVIKQIARCLERSLRQHDRLYRLGGDEFATILPNAEPAMAKAIADRCLEQIQEHDFQQYGLTEPVRISIGIAHANCETEKVGLSELQKRADLAMYAAKRPSSSKIVFYQPELGEVATLVANRAVSGVFQAIQDPGLVQMRYQAIMRLPEMEQEYVEALASIHFDGHLLAPADIFPIVEARRLDAEFDLSVILAVQRDMQNGRLGPDLGVSINVSAPGIVHGKVVAALLALRQAAGNRKIVIEITETALITQMAVASEHIERLRRAGCLVALDDFGSGYSSLRYLSSMPVDLVKFDISMVRLLEHADPQQQVITSEVARMVRKAGYKIVAEGIETEALLDKVRTIGFDYAQGYYFGKPS